MQCDILFEETLFTYKKQKFNADDFAEKMGRLLTDPKYKANAERMRLISRVQGGPQRAAQIVENAYIHYTAQPKKVNRIEGKVSMREPTHLIQNEWYDVAAGINYSKSRCAICLLVILMIYVLLWGWVGLVPGVNTDVWIYQFNATTVNGTQPASNTTTL